MLTFALALALAVPAQLSFIRGTQVVVEGDSNAHPWSCSTGAVNVSSAQAELEPPDGAPGVRALRLVIPVGQLNCGNGTMEEKLREALKAEQHPDIAFVLTSMKESEVAAGARSYQVTGDLTIAGKTRPVSFALRAAPATEGTLVSTGSVRLLMSDFGVEPPSAMLGLLRTADPIVVKLQLRVRLAAFTN